MTFTELATELCNRCGEGYQDYVNPAKEMLYQAFDTLILNNLATEDEYFGLINTTLPFSFTSEFNVYDIVDSTSDGIVKILAVMADSVKLDALTNAEYNVYNRISALISSPSFYYSNGYMILINIPHDIPTNLTITYVKKYKEASAIDDINKYISISFAEKALDLAQPKLYAEINS